MVRSLLLGGSLSQTHLAFASPLALNFFSWLVFLACFVAPATAAGPLSVSSGNPRFFIDSTGKAVYLTGVHLNNSLVDRSDKAALDFTSYVNFFQKYEHNFIRLWTWEQAAWTHESTAKITFDPLPYQRKGPGTALDGGRKFDLTRFNQAYFDRLRSRVIEAGERGIYVSVMLFQGFRSERKTMGAGNPWTGHPFNLSNNINGINGDPSGNDNGEQVHSLVVPAITSLQEAYVRKVVDTLNDLDNVLYEISGDALASSREWQYYMINYLKNYQAKKPKQHPVGMSSLYLGSANDLLASPADWILLPVTDTDPPLAAGNKVIFSDIDPKLLTSSSSYPMVWKSFMRGFNPIYLESDLANPSADENVRGSMGYALKYSQFVDLSSISPSSELCSTGYCLINPGREYLVYLPVGGTVQVDLSAVSGSLAANWFSPTTGQTTSGIAVGASSSVLLTSPLNADAVLHLKAPPIISAASSGLSTVVTASMATAEVTSAAAVIAPTISPNGGSFAGSVTVTLQTSTAGASIYYTTDGTNPTQSSTPYNAPFALTTTSLVKAQAFRNGMTPSAVVTAWFTGDTSASMNLTSVSKAGDEANVIALAWTDNSNNEDGFGIERKTGTNGTFSRIASVGANVNSYSDSGVVAGNTYCYRVNAFNAAGASGYTNEACKTMTAPAPTFDFSLVHGGNKSVTQGQSTTNTITATLSTGSSQSVSFSTSGLPSGATASYSTSNSCTPTCSRTLTIVTATSTPAGTYAITVTATGGGVTKTTNFSLTVNATAGNPAPSTYTLSATPTMVQAGGTITVSWTAPSGSSTTDWIALYATGAANTAYGWWQYTNGAASGSFAVPAPSSGGTYEFRYLLNDGFTSVKQSNAITVTLTAPTFDFSLTNGGNKSVTQGQSATNTITATLSSGSSQAVSFSTSGLPTGATASYTTSTSCNPTCSRTLNIATAASTPAGTYSITVTGAGGGVTKTTHFSLTVNAPASTYALSATPTTVQAGGTITVSWTAPSGSSTTDWIALYATGAANTAYGWWQYTNGAASGSFAVPAPSSGGTYEFRYLLNDGFTSVKQSNTITVKG